MGWVRLLAPAPAAVQVGERGTEQIQLPFLLARVGVEHGAARLHEAGLVEPRPRLPPVLVEDLEFGAHDAVAHLQVLGRRVST